MKLLALLCLCSTLYSSALGQNNVLPKFLREKLGVTAPLPQAGVEEPVRPLPEVEPGKEGPKEPRVKVPPSKEYEYDYEQFTRPSVEKKPVEPKRGPALRPETNDVQPEEKPRKHDFLPPGEPRPGFHPRVQPGPGGSRPPFEEGVGVPPAFGTDGRVIPQPEIKPRPEYRPPFAPPPQRMRPDFEKEARVGPEPRPVERPFEPRPQGPKADEDKGDFPGALPPGFGRRRFEEKPNEGPEGRPRVTSVQPRPDIRESFPRQPFRPELTRVHRPRPDLRGFDVDGHRRPFPKPFPLPQSRCLLVQWFPGQPPVTVSVEQMAEALNQRRRHPSVHSGHFNRGRNFQRNPFVPKRQRSRLVPADFARSARGQFVGRSEVGLSVATTKRPGLGLFLRPASAQTTLKP